MAHQEQPPEPQVMVGATIDGRYVVEQILGRGGMGIVYLARHRVIGKKVALKVLRSDLARDAQITDRFLQEAKAASSIGNPHIVDVSDFGALADGSTYFAMEWLDGVPLTQILGEHLSVPLERLTKIGRQIADGLAAAHDAGIVHRDLKPDNIFLVKQGAETDFVKILDFGIAKVANAVSRHTRAGMVVGTPHYMAPEQASGGAVDNRTDIYALGVILYEMAAGRLPFDAEDVMAIMSQHMFRRPTTIRSVVQVSPELEAVIIKALSKEPAERYQTMRELSADLAKIERGIEPAAVVEMMERSASMFPPELFERGAGETTLVMFGRKPARGRGKAYAIAALVAVALAAVAAVLGVRSRRPAVAVPVAAAVAPTAFAPAVLVPAAPPVQEPAPASVEVLLATDPLEAHVYRGEQNLGSAPLTIAVAKGEVISLEVRCNGYRSANVTVDGTNPKLSVKLAPIRGGARPPARRTKSGAGSAQTDIVNPWAKK